MSKNAMAGAVTLCGVGLCTIGGALLMQSGQQAYAAGVPASAARAQAGPTVVWMGVTVDLVTDSHVYHRMWSDGRIDQRWVYSSDFDYNCLPDFGCSGPWTETPPPPGGNGFACRTDINGDRIVDGTDLAFILNSWGEEGGCEPDATYPCLDLGGLAGGVALK
jgi:hypothetical protein